MPAEDISLLKKLAVYLFIAMSELETNEIEAQESLSAVVDGLYPIYALDPRAFPIGNDLQNYKDLFKDLDARGRQQLKDRLIADRNLRSPTKT